MQAFNIRSYKMFLPIVAAAIALAPITSTQAQSSEFGTVEVQLSFPSDFTPAMKVCAQSTDNFYLLSCTETEEGPPGGTAELNIRSGEYFIFTTVLGERTQGGDLYTQYYVEPASGSRPTAVNVVAGERITGITPQNPVGCLSSSKPPYCVEPPQ